MPRFNQFFPREGHVTRLTSMIERLMEGIRRVGIGAQHPVAGGRDRTDEDRYASQTASSSWQGGVLREIMDHGVTLGPLVKRREYPYPGQLPKGLSLGWAQMPETHGRAFSLGLFSEDGRFSQLALADDRGRVFIGVSPVMDTHALEPCLIFGKEGGIRIPRRPRMTSGGTGVRHGVSALAHELGLNSTDGDPSVDVLQGGIVGRDDSGQMMWLASWLKRDNRYTLEQLRADLPESMRFDLEYRDAVAIAFFAAYMVPRMNDLLIGFGSGNIFRRLNREAPIGAIRRSVRDTVQAQANGMRTSGLEEYFADLMREAGALDLVPGLEAVHGAEPLHLYTSSYSGNYFLTWTSSLDFSPALTALRIEGNLNRFAAISALLERNARRGVQPIEDTVTRAQAARIDFALLQDPALSALQSMRSSDDQPVDIMHDDDVASVLRMVDEAHRTATAIAAEYRDPTSPQSDASGHADDVRQSDAKGSAWVYRQSMATMLCSLRLPYRFDVEFRANLERHNAAIAFTTAGMSMMPTSRYDITTHSWISLDDVERARMSALYNLRVGLMMAAISFGADPDVNEVSLHIDSLGLEEAVSQQDSAIAKLMGRAFAAFDRMRNPDAGMGSSKADPKDGDIHGDPSRANAGMDETQRALREDPTRAAYGSHDADPHGSSGQMRVDHESSDGVGDHAADTAASGPDIRGTHGDNDTASSDIASSADTEGSSHQNSSSQDSAMNRQFEDLMKDVDFPDIDEMTFANPDNASNMDMVDDGVVDGEIPVSSSAVNDDADGRDDPSDGDDEDPMSALRRNPTVRNMVTVTFSREAFMRRLREDGLKHPIDTYRLFNAAMNVNEQGALQPVNAEFNLRDARFSPVGAQEEPEFSDIVFEEPVARILGADRACDLSIQRVDLLQRASSDFHAIAAETDTPSVDKAQRAMRIIDDIGDPELDKLASQVGSAFIDGGDTPEFDFPMMRDLDAARLKARDLLFSGQVDQAIQFIETAIARFDTVFTEVSGVPRYFNSYAERVIYNRLFATPGERTVLIPDNLFYAHMELSDVLAQIKGAKASLPHLNAMVSYAPAYPLSHMKLAIQLARDEDWDSARAACLNALRVSLDRDDAAFAYYRFAYASWMRDELDVAVAAYMMSDHIASGQIAALDGELRELVARAQSQCIRIPSTVQEAQEVLREHNLPVWPHTEAARIVRDAARVCVDNGMFVPARTLSVAAARMNDSDNEGIDIVQAQFLRSLNI